MHSLDALFRDVRTRLLRPEGLNPAQSNPLVYLVHEPRETVEIRTKLPAWKAQLESDGHAVVIRSFADLVWDVVEKSGELDELIAMEIEEQADWATCNASIAAVLQAGDSILHAFAKIQEDAPANAVVLMTDAAALHPYFRVRSFENHPISRVSMRTVIFYPGRRTGQYGLHFLGFYDNDPNYRCTMVGGNA